MSGHGHRSPSDLGVAFLLNFVFTLVELAGGIWTNSISILSDAIHDAGDCLSLGLAWCLQRVSHRTPDAKFTYGYRRFSTLGALATSLVLMGGVGYVCWRAVARLQKVEEVVAPGMMALSVMGILFNGYAAWKLHGSGSLNKRMASWHLLEDTLGWIAVLIGSGVIAIWKLPIVDPLLSLGISAFVLWNVFRNLRKVGRVFLQGAPPGFDLGQIERQISGIFGVIGVHHSQTWTLDGEAHVFSTHVVLKKGSSREVVVEATRRVRQLLAEQGFEHVTVEAEIEGEPCGIADQSESSEAGQG